MNILLYILGVVAGLWGCVISLLAKSAIHEIQAYVMYLIAAVLIVGGGIIGAVHQLRAQVREEARVTRNELEAAIAKAGRAAERDAMKVERDS